MLHTCKGLTKRMPHELVTNTHRPPYLRSLARYHHSTPPSAPGSSSPFPSRSRGSCIYELEDSSRDTACVEILAYV